MASIGLFYFLPMSLNAQLPDLNCNTKKLSGDTSCNPDLLSMNETDPVVLRIYLHVIRTDQGFGGATVTQLENSLSILTSDYAEYDISFVPQKIKDNCAGLEDYINYIDESSIYSVVDRNTIFGILSQYSHSDGIDLYYFDDQTTSAEEGVYEIRANGIVVLNNKFVKL